MNTVPVSDVTHGWDVWVLDIEVTDSTKLGCNWDMTASFGFRYVEYQEAAALLDEGDALIAVATNLTGYGLTAAVEFRRQVSCNLGVFGNFRLSGIMGDEDNISHEMVGILTTTTVDTQLNDVKFIYEAQAGVEYIIPICDGGYYFIRGGAEFQYWNEFGVDNQPLDVTLLGQTASMASNASVGFGGFTVSAGLQR